MKIHPVLFALWAVAAIVLTAVCSWTSGEMLEAIEVGWPDPQWAVVAYTLIGGAGLAVTLLISAFVIAAIALLPLWCYRQYHSYIKRRC